MITVCSRMVLYFSVLVLQVSISMPEFGVLCLIFMCFFFPLKFPLFSFSLQLFSFNCLLRAFGVSGMTIDCKHSRKSFQILSAVISPGTNNFRLQLFSKECPTSWINTVYQFPYQPLSSSVSTPASGKDYKSDICIF